MLGGGRLQENREDHVWAPGRPGNPTYRSRQRQLALIYAAREKCAN